MGDNFETVMDDYFDKFKRKMKNRSRILLTQKFAPLLEI